MKTPVYVGAVVQLDPDTTTNDHFKGCFLIVTEVKKWGVQGYVTIPGQGQAYYRAPEGTFHYIGKAEWTAQ